MIRQQAINAYRTATMTVPPLHAVVMLFDAILVRVHNAGLAAAEGDWTRQSEEISRAVVILRGLMSALDYQRGGDVAYRLQKTYDVNITALQRSVGRAEGVVMSKKIEDGLRALRNAWAHIAGLADAPPLGDATV